MLEQLIRLCMPVGSRSSSSPNSDITRACSPGTYQQDCPFEDEIEMELYILAMATDDGYWLPELVTICSIWRLILEQRAERHLRFA